ncbi:MAG: NADH-quinone oxidoreductase subunit NuoH [Anaerolineae bacterium]|nr:NADH-quinone oxidoreductase subunit NuoH [Anaerolineae bacterium]
MECTDIINTLAACLEVSGTDPGLAQFIQILLGVVIVTMAPLIVVILLIWVERKFAARVQDRIGPNRVGPYGLLQTIADALKLIIKEDITPAGADRLIYNLAPIISVVSVVLIWAVIPFSPIHIGVDLSIGALYFVAVGSIGTLAIMMAGWSSNNKYALLGAFRVVAQLVSYEVPMVFALLVPVLIAGSMSMQGIVEAQRGMWFVILSPVAALIFFISTQAETGRAPFDLIEAESELVAGFNIEYSGMKFGLFFAGEFVHVFTNALLMASLFFGGWVGPAVDQVPALGFIYVVLKAAIFYLFSLLLRNTLPRVRIDQLMAFNWKFLVPVSIVNVIVVAFLLQVVRALGLAPSAELSNDFIANLPQAIVLLVGSLAIVIYVLQQLRNFGRQERLSQQTVTVRKEDEVDMLPAQAAH